jgi:putative Mn2+ efflux pump MntP
LAQLVALSVATFAVSARPRLRFSQLVASGLPVVGLLAGLGVGRTLGGPADYAGAVLLVAAAALLLADDEAERWAWAASGLGLGIGLLRPPFVPAVIMIGVQAVVASLLGLTLGGSLSARARLQAQQAAAIAFIAIGIYVFFARLAG